MGRNEKIKVCKIIAILFCTGVFTTSCNTLNTFNYKQVSCDFDYRVEKEDMVLDTLKYVLFKEYENDTCIIRSDAGYDIEEKKLRFYKFVHYKKTGLRELIRYYPDFKIKDASFKFMDAEVGKVFDFDENGNITKITDNDEGYAICGMQALAIGRHLSKGQLHETEANEYLGKKKEDGRNCWIYVYFDKEMQAWRIVIDAQTGKVLSRKKI